MSGTELCPQDTMENLTKLLLLEMLTEKDTGQRKTQTSNSSIYSARSVVVIATKQNNFEQGDKEGWE